jgi:hypothetical protein
MNSSRTAATFFAGCLATLKQLRKADASCRLDPFRGFYFGLFQWPAMRLTRIPLLRSFAITVIFFTVLATGCQRRTSLVIEAGNPLRFVLSGPGILTNLQVTGPDLEREPHRQGDGSRLPSLKVYWELSSYEGRDRSLDEVGAITYGKVPEGFVQVQPSSSAPPAPIVDRDLYNIRISVNDGDGINRFFSLRDGKVIAEGEP